jgi:integrase
MAQRRDGVWKQCPCPPSAECVKKHGTWSFQVRLGTDPVTGAPIREFGSGFRTRRQALDARDRLRVEAANGPVANDGALTVGEWLDQWYRELTERPDPPEYKTLQGYATNIRIWKPIIGHIRLRDLTREHVHQALIRLAQERPDSQRPQGRHGQWKSRRSVTTLERYRATLRRALTVAVERNRVRMNVAAGHFDALTEPKAARAVRAAAPRTMWAAHQTAEFFDSIAEHRWSLLYGCYALTGARRSEWLGGRWQNMNPVGDSLLISPAVVSGSGLLPCFVCPHGHQGRLFKPLPKSPNSVRWLPLPDQLVATLREHRRQQRQRPTPAVWVDHDLIFPDDDGGPLNPDEVTEEFHRLVAAASLPELTGVHALRHNAVSMLLHQGVPVEEVAKITGHDVGTLRRVYAHIIEDYARRSLQAHANAVLGTRVATN